MIILKSKDSGDFTVIVNGDDYDDLIKTIVDDCSLVDVTIRVKSDSEKYLNEALWSAAYTRVLKRDAEKSRTLIWAIKEMETKREAFPDDLGALYDQAEMTAVSAEKLDDAPIEVHVEGQKGEEEHEQSNLNRAFDEGRRDEVYAGWSGDREPDFGSPEEPQA